MRIGQALKNTNRIKIEEARELLKYACGIFIQNSMSVPPFRLHNIRTNIYEVNCVQYYNQRLKSKLKFVIGDPVLFYN